MACIFFLQLMTVIAQNMKTVMQTEIIIVATADNVPLSFKSFVLIKGRLQKMYTEMT